MFTTVPAWLEAVNWNVPDTDVADGAVMVTVPLVAV
jgi:hypothetical protein